jgi:hypothetical protein
VCRKPPTCPFVAVTGVRYSGASVRASTPRKVRDSQMMRGGGSSPQQLIRAESSTPTRKSETVSAYLYALSERVSSTIHGHGTSP